MAGRPMDYDFQFDIVLGYWPELLHGAWVTLYLSAGAMAAGLAIALGLALARTSKVRPARMAVTAYVELIRNTPFLVQLLLVFFGLPSLGIRLSPLVAGFVAMTVNVSAYSTEIVRAGIESISRGQIDAGRALGLRPLQIFLLVILPPAINAIYPALTSQFILMLLSSSVLSVISAEELTAAAANIDSITFKSLEVYIVVFFIYFAISSLFTYVFAIISRHAFKFATAGR